MKIAVTAASGQLGSAIIQALSGLSGRENIRESGLQWSIGRNGLYIEPDVEYMDTYKKEGKISNCAGEGLCSYTIRDELAYAYASMILKDELNGKVFNLVGEALSQAALCEYLNRSFDTQLFFEDMSTEDYLAFQLEHNGEYLGRIIVGIYEKIRQGEFEVPSDYEAATGRKHRDWETYFSSLS